MEPLTLLLLCAAAFGLAVVVVVSGADGTLLGARLVKRVPQARFRALLAGLLILAGAALIVTNI